MLKIGQVVKGELSAQTWVVKRKLGEGTQGIVYLVESEMGSKALKWYNDRQATEAQRKSINELIMQGAPKGEAGKRFVWPSDIVNNPDSNCFGYIMELINTSKYAELGDIFAHLKPAPTAFAKCKISENLAHSYQQLHLDGRCYRDISDGNLMFNPDTGDVLICDNDNVGVEGQSESQVSGTMEYMAPEIIIHNTYPSAKTDLHSLAVLLFRLWIWHHPLEGMFEYDIRCWDLPAKRKVYGENALFIFDPVHTENCLPSDPEYDTPRRFWKLCPEPLKRLFTKAFTRGLKNPSERVSETEWQDVCRELGDCIVLCPHDKAENYWYEGVGELKCWHCGKTIEAPIRLVLSTNSGKRYILLTKNARLLERHINPFANENIRNKVIGEMAQNPNNPMVWGLRNLTAAPWIMTLADGTAKEVPPQRAASISRGVVLNFGHGATGVFEQ